MKEYLFPLQERKEIAEDTSAFYFDTRGADFSFVAGQYAAFTVGEETKVFTIASSPHHHDFIMITTRMRPKPFKENLKTLPLGTKVKVSPARGKFVLPPDPTWPIALIAGGIGVTPFHAIVEWATREKKPYRLTLFYSNRTLALTAFLKEFQEWAKQNPNFRFVPTLTREPGADWPFEKGHIDNAMLKKYLQDLSEPLYYIVGPPAMVDDMRQYLLTLGIAADHIKIEKFSGY